MEVKPTLLCILDGFGLNPNVEGNAIAQATKKTFDSLWERCPKTTLTTFGEKVGLPEGQMGNSEVGHLNIGAGRIVEQWLVRISRLLENKEYKKDPEYQALINNVDKNNTIHLIGLFSDGGVHSHVEHLKLLINGLQADFKGKIALHLITDGRDTSPTLAADMVSQFEKEIESLENVDIASVSGRFYAMDRDTRWERIETAYKPIALGLGKEITSTCSEYLKSCYEQELTDEFIPPAMVNKTPIKEGDALFFWNYRADRMREIVKALCLKDFSEFDRTHPIPENNKVLCFTDYDSSYQLPFLFKPQSLENHLGIAIENAGVAQIRIAETEKYPHVTYFFNGGKEDASQHEVREVIPSPRDVKTYDEKPEMSAHAVTETVVSALKSKKYGFIVLNFANCDMVGHTGDVQAAVKAVETVDECLGNILEVLAEQNGQALIIADHGNAEQMIDYETGKPHTAHTTFPVPAIIYGRDDIKSLHKNGALENVAPTILKMLSLKQPKEMTGSPLF